MVVTGDLHRGKLQVSKVRVERKEVQVPPKCQPYKPLSSPPLRPATWRLTDMTWQLVDRDIFRISTQILRDCIEECSGAGAGAKKKKKKKAPPPAVAMQWQCGGPIGIIGTTCLPAGVPDTCDARGGEFRAPLGLRTSRSSDSELGLGCTDLATPDPPCPAARSWAIIAT